MHRLFGISASCNASNGRKPSCWETISGVSMKCFPPPSVIRSKRTNITHEKCARAVCVGMDGSIPLKITFIAWLLVSRLVDHIRKAAEGAAAIIAIGSCSAWGGVAAAGVNPTWQSACKKFCQAKPLSIFRAARRTAQLPRDRCTSSLTANRRNWMTKIDLRLWPSGFTNTANVARTSMLVVLPKSSVMKATVKAGACTHLGCKGPETYGQLLNAAILRC